jgi:phosphoribosylamine---glycine ligase
VRILVIGSGGREHAIVRSLAGQSHDLHAAPGNPGIAELAETHSETASTPEGITALARKLQPDLVVIGPEVPLVAGAADALAEAGITCFGPSQRAAQIEGSKSFAKDVMTEAGIATARSFTCHDKDAVGVALASFLPPFVVKDDALAAGKGVLVSSDIDAARAHAAGCATVVIEEYLDGPEVSLFALCDGSTAVPLLAAQDFKRAHDGDRGPNTGGMGAYAPLPWAPAGLADEVMDRVVMPAIGELARRGAPYQGVLYAGLALTAKGVKVIEFNARFGDPETQVVLDRLATPLAGLLHASAVGGLAAAPALRWHPGAAVTVVLAAEGYPESPAKGDKITIDSSERTDGYLLQAGTALAGGDLVTAGGRVLSAVGSGPDLASARAAAYAAASRASFRGAWHRHDIAERAASAD